MNIDLRRLAVTAVLLASSIAPRAAAQQATPPAIEYGRLTINGFELREERFVPPFRAPGADQKPRRFTAGWKVVLRGPDFPVRALDPILWIGDTPIRNYERSVVGDSQVIAFCVVDPLLLRAEHEMTLIYGSDERTRTRLLERLDPEKLVKLSPAERARYGMPELEGVTLRSVGADGQVAGGGKVSGGRIALAVRLEDGKLAPLVREVVLDADGNFAVKAGPLPEHATHVVALLVPQGELAAGLDLAALPKGIELLDSKPIGTAPAKR